MTKTTDSCSHCGSTLAVEDERDELPTSVRMPCPNPDCPGKWTATQFGGDGVRQSFDVPGLSGGAAS